MGDNCCLVDTMARYVGQTVTVFTTGGGLAGNGFTGVLSGLCSGTIKLITDIGAPPSAPERCRLKIFDCTCAVYI